MAFEPRFQAGQHFLFRQYRRQSEQYFRCRKSRRQAFFHTIGYLYYLRIRQSEKTVHQHFESCFVRRMIGYYLPHFLNKSKARQLQKRTKSGKVFVYIFSASSKKSSLFIILFMQEISEDTDRNSGRSRALHSALRFFFEFSPPENPKS